MNTADCPTCEGYGLVTDAPIWSSDPAWGTCPMCDGVGELENVRYCASCGELEGSDYAKRCCVDDNMIED